MADSTKTEIDVRTLRESMRYLEFLRKYGAPGANVEVVVAGRNENRTLRARILEFNDNAVVLEFEDAIEVVPGDGLLDARILKADTASSAPPVGRVEPPEPTTAAVPPASLPAVESPALSLLAAKPPAPDVFIGLPSIPLGEPDFQIGGLRSEDRQDVVSWKNKYEYALKVREFDRVRAILPAVERLARSIAHADLSLLAGHLAAKVGEEERAAALMDFSGSRGRADAWVSSAAIYVRRQRPDLAADRLVRALSSAGSVSATPELVTSLGRCVALCQDTEVEGLEVALRRATDDARRLAHELMGLALRNNTPAAEEARAGNIEAARTLAPASAVFRALAPLEIQRAPAGATWTASVGRPGTPTAVQGRTHRPSDGKPGRAPVNVRLQGLPKNASAYAKAKRSEQLDDLDTAVDLFLKEISGRGSYWQSAVKDLASLYGRRGEIDKAIALLDQHRNQCQPTRAIDNIKVNVLIKGRRFEQAAELLRSLRKDVPSGDQAVLIRQEAYCLSMAGSYEDAIGILDSLRGVAGSDPTTLALKEKIKQARDESAKATSTSAPSHADDNPAATMARPASAQPSLFDEEMLQLSGLSDSLSRLAQERINACELRGLDEVAKARGFFERRDFDRVDRQLGDVRGRRPRDRAELWLTLAHMQHQTPNAAGDSDIRRSIAGYFAHMGEAACLESVPLDVARCFLVESLLASAAASRESSIEHAATYLLGTYLQPRPGPGDLVGADGKVRLSMVLARFDDAPECWTAFLLDLPFYFALSPALAEFLARGLGRRDGRPTTSRIELPERRAIERQRQDEARRLEEENARLRSIASAQFTAAALGENSSALAHLAGSTRFQLDRQRVDALARHMDDASRFILERDYVEREGRHARLTAKLEDLASEIISMPTRLSIELLHPLVVQLKERLDESFTEFQDAATPVIEIANVLSGDYSTLDAAGILAIAIEAANRSGGAPVERLDVSPIEEEGLTCVEAGHIAEPLRGGDRREVRVRVRPSAQQIRDGAFTLRVRVEHRSRAGSRVEAGDYSLPVRLALSEAFEPVRNPYEEHSGGGEVRQGNMFFGRVGLLDRIERQMTTGPIGQCFVLYGQKRSGKSSVLVQLEHRIKAPALAVKLTLGAVDTSNAQANFVTLCLDRVEERIADDLGIGLRDWPDRASIAQDSVGSFRRGMRAARAALTTAGWVDPRVILLIDEFTYLYEYIEEGIVPPTFMRHWKGLLETQTFSAVLVGQDSMPKFKERYANEFARTHDERLSYLSLDEAKALATEPIALHGQSRYRGKALDKLMQLTAGNPFFLQIICDRLVRHINHPDVRSPFITEWDVDAVVQSLVGADGLGEERFDSLITVAGESVAEATRDQYLAVLWSIARASNLAALSELPSVANRDDLLKDMADREVIERDSAGRFSIRVGLFAEWLRFRAAASASSRGAEL
ncbi:MAG: hypothetical protein H6716_24520 [Polyangiaceae bacterium]|nr:hypothetical protein [Polyangiaceae bacterium]MCB9629736.1 hypothetical protein [Sandaracinaceae bacterium]